MGGFLLYQGVVSPVQVFRLAQAASIGSSKGLLMSMYITCVDLRVTAGLVFLLYAVFVRECGEGLYVSAMELVTLRGAWLFC